jgi:hypothetical protein
VALGSELELDAVNGHLLSLALSFPLGLPDENHGGS